MKRLQRQVDCYSKEGRDDTCKPSQKSRALEALEWKKTNGKKKSSSAQISPFPQILSQFVKLDCVYLYILWNVVVTQYIHVLQCLGKSIGVLTVRGGFQCATWQDLTAHASLAILT